MHSSKRNLTYWIATILIALNWTFGLVGALMPSRAVGDPTLSDEILEATAREFGRL